MAGKKITLKAEERKITGKKVKSLRNEGKVPAVLFGKGLESRNIELDAVELRKVFEEAGYSNFITLELGSENVSVIIKSLDIHPITRMILHVEFYQIDMKSEITAEVPLVFEGTPVAVKNNIGLLITPVEELSLRCLPHDLPSEIVIDISNLSEVGDSISIQDITLPENVELEPGIDIHQSVVTIVPPQMDESMLEREEVSPDDVEILEKGKEDDEEEGAEEGKKPEAKEESVEE
ncbi:50S ribosomal protein L25 [Candidatus Dojkabacteria bacterium]|uniref:Large ribosomal subunit protein bL25 n=1 Tax=Candidatus Dojkabacteria bacterium TaxID=2099670 RepID=A0A955L2P5_9BACT|nr:50S ribosomal protein L25 [Candidatus Dojkabacteria bacterium]